MLRRMGTFPEEWYRRHDSWSCREEMVRSAQLRVAHADT